MAPNTPLIDGNWIDICSLILSIGYVTYRNHKCGRPLISAETGKAIASGVSLFPLAILSFAIFSSWLVDELIHANRLILSLAGIMSLLSIYESGKMEDEEVV